MKKRVKQYSQQIELGTQDRRFVLKDFSRMLDVQVCCLCALHNHESLTICIFRLFRCVTF